MRSEDPKRVGLRNVTCRIAGSCHSLAIAACSGASSSGPDREDTDVGSVRLAAAQSTTSWGSFGTNAAEANPSECRKRSTPGSVSAAHLAERSGSSASLIRRVRTPA